MLFGQSQLSLTRNLAENSEVKLVKSLNLTLCVLDKKCVEGEPEFGREITEASHSIKYKSVERKAGNIKLKSENIGTDLVPKYVLTAEVSNVDAGVDLSKLVYIFKRKIEGRDERFIEIASTYNSSIIDMPFEEGEINENQTYTVKYKVIAEFPDGRTLDSMNQNEAIFSYSLQIDPENPEEEIEEEEAKKGGLPIYIIIIIIVVALAVLVAGGFLLYKLLSSRKGEPVNIDSEIAKQNDINQKPKRSIKNVPKVISFSVSDK